MHVVKAGGTSAAPAVAAAKSAASGRGAGVGAGGGAGGGRFMAIAAAQAGGGEGHDDEENEGDEEGGDGEADEGERNQREVVGASGDTTATSTDKTMALKATAAGGISLPCFIDEDDIMGGGPDELLRQVGLVFYFIFGGGLCALSHGVCAFNFLCALSNTIIYLCCVLSVMPRC